MARSDSPPTLRVVSDQDLSAQTDDDLMILAAAGRRDAFEVLVGRHTAVVLGTATRFLGDRARAREVAQEVFLMLWTERDRYQPRGKLRNLLVTMTFNRCRVVARKSKSDRTKSERLALLDVASDPGTPLDAVIEKSRAARVRRELTTLPESVREILIMRYTHDLSLNEIAEITDKPVGTIKSHVFRGLRRLRGAFGGEQP